MLRNQAALLILFLTPSPAPADIVLSSPTTRAVYQRDPQGVARIPVTGTFDDPLVDRLEARVVPQDGVDDDAVGWQAVDGAKAGEEFSLFLTLDGGWYRLQVRALTAGSTASEVTVDRVGVGEVFVTAGQSNSANHGQPRLEPLDDRVSAWDGEQWRPAADPQPIATGSGGSPWPPLGDLLARELEVPIGFVSVGWGGTRVEEWLPGGRLYPRLQEALKFVGPHGLRAVLWHQGESDHVAGTSAADYVERLTAVISQSRRDAGFELPWGIALVSFVPDISTSKAVIGAQRQVIASDALVFEGPATDAFTGPEWRYDGIHFNAAGLREHARLWVDKIEEHFDLSERPAAIISLDRRFVAESEPVTANAVDSAGEDGRSIVSWTWDFGDGAVAAGETVTHAYASPGRYTVTLTVVDDGGFSDVSEEQVTVTLLAGDVSPWVAVDVGTPGFPGAARLEDGCLRLSGAAGNITSRRDAFHFVHQRVAGDFRLTARISDWTTAVFSSKLGLMIRESLESGARHAAVTIEGNSTRFRHRFRWREDVDGATRSAPHESYDNPRVWLRIERRGTVLSGQLSFDQTTWFEPDTAELAELGDEIHVGIAVAYVNPRAEDEPSLATVCDVALEALPAEPAARFLRGDCDGDGDACSGVNDALRLFNWLFLGRAAPPCPAACDPDGNERLELADAVYNLSFCFRGAQAPVGAFPECDSKTNADAELGCATPTCD